MLVDTLSQTVLVPTPAVLSGAPGNYVYLVNSSNNTVSVRKITLGPSDGTNTAVLSGLAAGDTVVIDGTDRLSDGAKISISTANATSGTAPSTAAPQPATKKKNNPGTAAQGAPTSG
jgi:multidrug efflux system membrane fusion protein